jgi:Asp-tRNA(Asn)/Glu-tRNA(Gln) amidotransferase A subunit family amidase
MKLRTAGAQPESVTVAVPSRLSTWNKVHNSCSPHLPLLGWRVAVKDNFEIKNVRTSACNRAFYELYPPRPKTATCIQNIYNAGAIVVGTTKLASFAATEEPMECIDWPAPWNPRADGYQSPAGSSSGSGAAVSAYSWLDIAIGSDSGLFLLDINSRANVVL